jgi:hypothetical protein
MTKPDQSPVPAMLFCILIMLGVGIWHDFKVAAAIYSLIILDVAPQQSAQEAIANYFASKRAVS